MEPEIGTEVFLALGQRRSLKHLGYVYHTIRPFKRLRLNDVI